MLRAHVLIESLYKSRVCKISSAPVKLECCCGEPIFQTRSRSQWIGVSATAHPIFLPPAPHHPSIQHPSIHPSIHPSTRPSRSLNDNVSLCSRASDTRARARNNMRDRAEIESRKTRFLACRAIPFVSVNVRRVEKTARQLGEWPSGGYIPRCRQNAFCVRYRRAKNITLCRSWDYIHIYPKSCAAPFRATPRHSAPLFRAVATLGFLVTAGWIVGEE